MSIFLPCLLERWSTETPQGTGARGVFNTWQDVRRDVIRNLEWLLNTEAPPRLAGQVPSEAVQRSVLCFGIEPYSGRPQSGMDPKEMSWRIRERILAFESRVDHHTLEVMPAEEDGQRRFNKMRFTVRGHLRADPLPLEFVVQTEIDMESGVAKVTG